MRGRKRYELGDARGKGWELPNSSAASPAPARAQQEASSIMETEPTSYIDTGQSETPQKRPAQKSHSAIEPASKLMPPPDRVPPGFRPTPVPGIPTFLPPEHDLAPAQPEYTFSHPSASSNRNTQLYHESQTPIGGLDLVSVLTTPSLTGTSVSQSTHGTQPVPTPQTERFETPTERYSYIPKSELHSLYGQHGKLLSANHYHTWHDSGPAHDLRWTSVFICPITTEIFASAPYAGSSDVKPANGSCWFIKKSHAEHAAAAVAYDCWMLRNNVQFPTKLSLEQNPTSSYMLPPTAPATVRFKVEEQQRVFRQNNNH